MGYTVHQMLVKPPAQPFPRFSGAIAAVIMIDRRLSADCLTDQFFRFVDTVRHPGLNHPFPVKPGHLHIFIRRNNNTFRRFDFPGRQPVFHAAGAVCFHLHRISHALRLPFQGFLSHIGMGDSRRTGRHCKNPERFPVLRFIGPFAIRTEFFGFRPVDDFQKPFRRIRRHQTLPEPVVHKEHG